MNKWSELVLGLILVIVPIIIAFATYNRGLWDFGTAAIEFLKGGIFWLVLMIGVLFIILGISDLKG